MLISLDLRTMSTLALTQNFCQLTGVASLIELQDGRLRSGDHILQIGEVNVGGMGSEQVAQVLRKVGQHVKLVIARLVIGDEPMVDVVTTEEVQLPAKNCQKHITWRYM